MIRSALEFIAGLPGGFQTIEEKGRKFLFDKNGNLKHEFKNNYQGALKTSTLSSIVDYFAGDPDKVFDRDKKYIIRIVDPERVLVESAVSDEMNRDGLLQVDAFTPERFAYDRYMDLEFFNIQLQSRFEYTDDLGRLLALTANVVDETVKSYGDNGVSQTATVKSGVTSVADVIVPNPVTLKPFRTFSEAKQPESKFVFRLRKDDDGVTAALIEADGGAWKVQAMQNIAAYLIGNLSSVLTDEQMQRITILA